jgi:hypothetical protein
MGESEDEGISRQPETESVDPDLERPLRYKLLTLILWFVGAGIAYQIARVVYPEVRLGIQGLVAVCLLAIGHLVGKALWRRYGWF